MDLGIRGWRWVGLGVSIGRFRGGDCWFSGGDGWV